ncbi:MAG TPA: AarF/UbiB family protein, partial [Caulobacteraceae bacterium]|nr:AarF/UbiB family protein [Caulobacteraceae bacterium]
MSTLTCALRLVGAGWVLVRHDALAPREIDELLPGPAQIATRFLRLFAGAQARAGRPGERLARALERLGPVSIKLGQLLSTRADIFGAVFAQDLSRLKDRLPPFPAEVARAEVERALGRPVESLFSAFGEAVAAASLAQAHPATLLDGRAVAVKV